MGLRPTDTRVPRIHHLPPGRLRSCSLPGGALPQRPRNLSPGTNRRKHTFFLDAFWPPAISKLETEALPWPARPTSAVSLPPDHCPVRDRLPLAPGPAPTSDQASRAPGEDFQTRGRCGRALSWLQSVSTATATARIYPSDTPPAPHQQSKRNSSRAEQLTVLIRGTLTE